jgi:hypothetical protein
MELNERDLSPKLPNLINAALTYPLSKHETKNNHTPTILRNRLIEDSNHPVKQLNKIKLRYHNKSHGKTSAAISKRRESKKQYEDCNEKKIVSSNCSSEKTR